MRLFTTVAALRCYLRQARAGQLNCEFEVGLVPTMGALHAGHLSLIAEAQKENDVVVVSIFVNPLQFGPTEDFHKYPRQLEFDRQLCEQVGVDVVFAPTAAELGVVSQEQVKKEESSLPVTQATPPAPMVSLMCGRSRPGHFQGVTTIVAKLFNIVQPEKAYFGQKDAQQLAIIRRMVQDLNFPVKIVGCPIIREPSGLALSSRNQYLTPEQKAEAAILYQGLKQAETAFYEGEVKSQELIAIVKAQLARVPSIQTEYVELVHPDTLKPLAEIKEVGLLAIAARLGSTRLIDNILLSKRQPIVAIDGPAGAGKSTVARLVAQNLGLLYLDTGAMYRALTWLVLKSGISVDDRPGVTEIASTCQIELRMSDIPETGVRVWINGQECTQEIRSIEVTSNVSAIAAQKAVRDELVKQQRQWGEKGGLVAEGRDIGTHVFPDAELKIFLTASVEERARRRRTDLQNQGEAELSLERMQKDLSERDWKDSNRDIAPLQKATDAIEIQTDGLSIAQVTEQITSLYWEKTKH
ncbi:bifunctional pantoate--beta-alanine ligase/(d)CMP kinase [Phormidium sp. LEGE 05292]|uniref:bifunctional pantoate--beta-alanine ligase/(d)CMP kinase n=1 Tax=[Phormidium] sp. LEGE 05292 TaxID=767427 RepID=UPI00187ED06A|nr:bifunctional pantoate--beta-alanine ligase/(d)CMP kinase [Phormidium sp. LEGE 05292]MBE9226001.1 bifunctional pantoate--beta-alanine ligase/(d)CMP kinase [Phormidium sp. LEGE 05292]